MKNLVTLLFVALSSVGLISAQETATAPPVSNPNAPEIKFEKEVHDFGTLKQGADCVYEFKFTNVGKEPLIIQNATASCGCTIPTYSKEPILPGKSGSIKVKYDGNRVGGINKDITITSNAITSSKVVKITGNILAVPKEEAFPGTSSSGVTVGPVQK
jgi:hypothetical protein